MEHIQIETLKVLESLLLKNDPDLEIHIALIMPQLIHVFDTSNASLRE